MLLAISTLTYYHIILFIFPPPEILQNNNFVKTRAEGIEIAKNEHAAAEKTACEPLSPPTSLFALDAR